MKLVYISNGNLPSHWAHTVQTVRMAEALAAQVPSFALVTACDARTLLGLRRRIFAWYGVRRRFAVHPLPIAWRADPEVFQRTNVREFTGKARRYVRYTHPGLVWTRCHEVAQACLEEGASVIFETHDGPGHPKTMRFIHRFGAFPNLRGVVTTSPLLEKAFAEEGVPPERLIARPNAVDLERFEASRPAPAEARRRLGLDPDRPLVLYVGSLQPHKGVGTLIAAAARLPDVGVQLVGATPETAAAWAPRLAGHANVALRGFVPNAEVPAWLAAADVCVVPNSQDDRTARWTYSLKLYEAMAARRPVVASDIPSLRAAARADEEALLVPPDDPDALAAAVRRLLSDPGLAARLVERAWARVAANTWEARARAVLGAFAPDLLDA